MKKLLSSLTLLFLCSIIFAWLPAEKSQAEENDAYTYDLARLLTGDGYSGNYYDFGTFTLTDLGDSLRVTVTLNPDSIYVDEGTHVKVVSLNYEEGSPFSSYTFRVEDSSALNDENNVKMGGSKDKFDLRVPGKGKSHPRNTTDYQFTYVISAYDGETQVPLDIEDLINTTGDSDVSMALHLGGLKTNIDNSDSVWAGFTNEVSPPPPPPPPPPCPGDECGSYDLARLLTGEGYSGTYYDFGTFNVTDQGDSLQIKVSLNPDSIYVNDETHVKTISLNFPEGSEYSTYTFVVEGFTVLNDEDSVKMGGSKDYFDLKLPGQGKIHPKYTTDYEFSFTITAYDSDGNVVQLDIEDLINETGDSDVLVALHLGGLETDIDGSDSVWVPFIDDDCTASPT